MVDDIRLRNNRQPITEHSAGELQIFVSIPLDSELTGDLCWSNDARFLAVASTQGVYICTIGEAITLGLIRTPNAVLSAKISPDGRLLACGGTDKLLYLFALQRKEPLAILHGHKNVIADVAFHPYGTYVVSAGSWDFSAIIWDLERRSLKYVMKTRAHSNTQAVSFSADGGSIYVADLDNILNIWDTRSGTRLNKLTTGHSGGIMTISVSKSGTVVVSGDMNGLVQVWNMPRFEVAKSFLAHRDGVWKVICNSAGDLLATGGMVDDTIRLWNLAGIELNAIHEEKNNALAVAFSPDNTMLAVTGSRGILKLYGVKAH